MDFSNKTALFGEPALNCVVSVVITLASLGVGLGGRVVAKQRIETRPR